MATEPSGVPDAIQRLPRRPKHFAPYRFGRFIVLVFALIGVIAIRAVDRIERARLLMAAPQSDDDPH